MTKNNEDFLFTCKNCGSHDLYLEHYYTVWQGNYWTTYVERGSLNIDSTDEHRIEDWDDPEEVESDYDDSVETEEVDEEEEVEAEIDEDSHEYYVRCVCDREIEFGWSHPERGGRIWPAECKDFNPWKCWPESRYVENWEKKNWLRPTKEKNGKAKQLKERDRGFCN